MALLMQPTVILQEWENVEFSILPQFRKRIYLTPKGQHGFYEWIIYSIKAYFGSFNVSRDTDPMSYNFNILAGVRKTKSFDQANYTSLADFRHEVNGVVTSGVEFDANAFMRDTDYKYFSGRNGLYAFDYAKGVVGQGPISIWIDEGGENNVANIVNAPLVNFFIEYDFRRVQFPYDWDNLHYERS